MSEAVAVLRQPETIRARCHAILAAGRAGRLTHFEVDDDALDPIAAEVARVTQRNYPALDIPYHSRWNHFRAGGVDRAAQLAGAISEPDRLARAQLDLVVTSVLLDAGAGAAWQYVENGTGFPRSEGLAVASFHLFMSGAFSSDPHDPLRADADGLERFDAARLAEGFQVRSDNPLVGLDGRAQLMRRLGAAMRSRPDLFGREGRPGGLVDAFHGSRVSAAALLGAVLDGLSPIWPGRHALDGHNLGDVWPHHAAGGEGATRGLVPFHKLSQWLTYSLLEPFEWRGATIEGVDRLTGLAEYRNGGLFVDGRALLPRHERVLGVEHAPSDEVIVEWRALTVALLDELAPRVRARLGKSAEEFPLAKVLEGGTWQTGRELARARSADASPPIRIVSDGTVF